MATASGATQITGNGQVLLAGLDTSGIANFVNEVNRLGSNLAGLQSSGFANLFDDAYVDGSKTKNSFLASLQSGSYTSVILAELSVYACNIGSSSCRLDGTVNVSKSAGITDTFKLIGDSVKLSSGVWRLYGSQNTGCVSSNGSVKFCGTGSSVVTPILSNPAISFSATGSPSITLAFAEDMRPFYGTTGAYNPASSTWPTLRIFKIVFNSYVSGGTITFQKASFSSVLGGKMANDITYTFP